MNRPLVGGNWFRSVIAVALVFAAGQGWAADNQSEITKRLAASVQVLDEVMATPSKAIPSGIIQRATCVAVFPSTVQVAILVGAKHGRGFATCRTPDGWSAPAPLDISGGSWGAQLGGEQVDLVVVITTEKGLQQLLSGKLDLGTETSVTAGPVGTHDWKMNADMLTYSRSRGLFAGTNLSGSSITSDQEDSRTLYGVSPSLSDVLTGKTQHPGIGESFISTVAKYAGATEPNN